MAYFINGKELCKGFFNDHAKAIIEEAFPGLIYSAGLIGYGSDVAGFDDEISTDHMWGPRFYMFLDEKDIGKKEYILSALAEKLPYTYKGFSTNFTPPAPDDNGVRHPKFITSGKVDPLVFISTFDEFLKDYLGRSSLADISPFEFLALSEHRLFSLASGSFFTDGLKCTKKLSHIAAYPRTVKLYLVASHWSLIAEEQAFPKRCGKYGDDIGSQIICARIAERLMRLCFLYCDKYAPYSKWFGTAFDALPIDDSIKEAISGALSADTAERREECLVNAQYLVAELHDNSGLTPHTNHGIRDYYGRDIKVIFAENIAEKVMAVLKGTELHKVPLIGSFSALGGVASITDSTDFVSPLSKFYPMISDIY